MEHLAGLQLQNLQPPLNWLRAQCLSLARSVCGQIHLEPRRPLSSVALVDKVGALNEVAGAGDDRGLGLNSLKELG